MILKKKGTKCKFLNFDFYCICVIMILSMSFATLMYFSTKAALAWHTLQDFQAWLISSPRRRRMHLCMLARLSPTSPWLVLDCRLLHLVSIVSSDPQSWRLRFPQSGNMHTIYVCGLLFVQAVLLNNYMQINLKTWWTLLSILCVEVPGFVKQRFKLYFFVCGSYQL